MTGEQVSTSVDRIRAALDRRRDAFFTKTAPGPDGCLDWVGGSVRFSLFNGQAIQARKAAWYYKTGEITSRRRLVLVRCGRKSCVSPDHIHLPTDIEKFWSHVNKTEGCWLWTGPTAGAMPYGHFCEYGRREKFHIASRFSYELHHGPIPNGMLVCHRCDVPLCVRPDHLFLGTDADNQADKVAKGRASRGAKHSAAVRLGKERSPFYGLRTACNKGHDWTNANNVYTNARGHRICRICQREHVLRIRGRNG